MKLVLTSGGLTTPSIIAACEKLVGKPKSAISVALINEGATAELGDKRWAITEPQHVIDTFLGELDIINLLALETEQIEARIAPHDIIYVVGGHTDYIMHVFEKSGLAGLLPKLLETKVYVGSSAGSMIAGKRISTQAYQEVYGENGTFGTKHYLELVDVAMKPHMDSPLFPHNRAPILKSISETYDGIIVGMNDEQAIVVDGDAKELSYVGGKPLRLHSGKAVR